MCVPGERNQEILQTAMEIMEDEGYASPSMRALARVSGIKLGALQYPFALGKNRFGASELFS